MSLNRNRTATPTGLKPDSSMVLGPLPPALQSSHPAIEIHANSLKTNTEKSSNRHTFSDFVFTRHASLFTNFSRPLSPFGSTFPFRNSSHSGGSISSNSMKILGLKFSTRHTLPYFALPSFHLSPAANLFHGPLSRKSRITSHESLFSSASLPPWLASLTLLPLHSHSEDVHGH